MPSPEFPLSEEEFRARIDGSADQWGRAHLTDIEWRNICQFKEGKPWLDVRRALARGEIPPPTIFDENGVLDEKGFIDLVVSDACPLAYPLIVLQGRTAESLIRSYTLKARAYRFIAGEIQNSKVLEAWRGMETKKEGEMGVLELMRPEGIPSNVLVGKGKVACYFPCQLLKELEAIGTGRNELLEPTFRKPITLNDEERELLRIPWEMYREAIRNSDCIEDIAVNIAVKTFEILHERGLDENKILALLFQGYRPHGPLLEQGQLERILEIWCLTASRLDRSYDIYLLQKVFLVIEDAIREYNGKAINLGLPYLTF